ncbi:oligosaccharide flippase family protein [Sphingorhabdus sp. Alg239-R122]|uniref:lipopolysaccharide biosynthesis protein n=1 Tax=Sphingorhabdus sp. Alg239-R122 TaxID=2305989 RepID=UPI0013DB4D24|nr:oligosaccharide flippase family protein [Sphingorhabdus sp. Alg239-R122]
MFHRFKTSDDTLARVGRNSAWLFSSKGVSAILSLAYLAIVTRTLGPAGFGVFILVVSAGQMLAALFRVQTWQAIVQFGTPLLAKNDQAGFRQLAKRGLTIETVGGVLACLLLYFLLPAAAARFGLTTEIEQGLLIYGFFILLAIRSTPTGILRAHDRFRDNALGETAVPVTRMAGALVLVAIGPSITGFLIIWGISELVSTVLLWVLVWRSDNSPGQRDDIEDEIDAIQPMPLKGGQSFYGFLAATNFSHLLTTTRERFVVIIVGLFVGASAAGLFRLADQLANSINRLTEVFARPMFAELSRLYGQSEKAELQSLFFRSLRISAISGAVIFTVLILAGKHIIYIMSGPEFVDAYPLLLLLAGATIIGLVAVGLEPLLQAAHRAAGAFVIRLLSLTVLGGLLYWLLPLYGVQGAALAMLVSAVVTAFLLLLMGSKVLRDLRK